MKKLLCEYLRLAYSDNIEWLKERIGCHYIKAYKNETTDSDLLVFYKGDKAYFLVRGTQRNWKDILINFISKPIKIKDKLKIHRGWYTKFIGIHRYFKEEALKAKENNIKHFIFIGDSAGGAVVSIAYYFFNIISIFEGMKISCFCIGTPAFGNRKFMDEIEDVEYYLNDSDPIRLIPLWVLGYRFSKKVKILKTGEWFKLKNHLPEKYKETMRG